MPHRYATSLFVSAASPAFLVAGAQGLTVHHAVIFNPVSAGVFTSLALQRVTSVVGGSPGVVVGLGDPSPTSLATAVTNPTSWTIIGRISESDLVGPSAGFDLLAVGGPVEVSPGNGLFIQLSLSGSAAALNLYFEE
jgi:hypothetical protein